MHGLLDAADPLREGPVRLITNPELSPRNVDQNIGDMTAGTTFVGQFLDHDVTSDTTSRLGVVTKPAQTPNTRDPRINLDSVYGGGPSASPQLYLPADRAKFRIESSGLFEDLPRNPDLTAIIADPRNDENLMIAGLHAAFLLAHNRAVDFRQANGLPGDPGGNPATGAPTSLPQRNLLRHLTWSMPSGQRIAASTGSPVLGSDHFPELRQYGIGLKASTPLWYYILRWIPPAAASSCSMAVNWAVNCDRAPHPC
ncbi:MAG: hypothetical protein ACRDRP_10925 [Pseudonocardiaceae bacterium]